MNVVIIGAGLLAKAAGSALERRGATVRMLSRSTGFDVFAGQSPTDLGAADAVIEATNVTTQNAKVAHEFFSASTRAAGAVARATGARHILVSIINCDHQALNGNGYYSGKAEQERIARSEDPDVTIVRTTQWFEFARQMLERMRFGPVAIVPAMTIQPIALETVSEVVADCVTGERIGPLHQVAGRHTTTLWRMTNALTDRPPLLLPVAVPGRAGRALRDGTLIPGPSVERIGPSFEEWLANQNR